MFASERKPLLAFYEEFNHTAYFYLEGTMTLTMIHLINACDYNMCEHLVNYPEENMEEPYQPQEIHQGYQNQYQEPTLPCSPVQEMEIEPIIPFIPKKQAHKKSPKASKTALHWQKQTEVIKKSLEAFPAI